MIRRSRDQDDLELVTFVVDGDRFVSVVGDFNERDPYANPMPANSAGQRTTSVGLPPGSYAVRYLGDGHHFHDDPDADSYVDNGDGDVNRVRDVALAPVVPRKGCGGTADEEGPSCAFGRHRLGLGGGVRYVDDQ